VGSSAPRSLSRVFGRQGKGRRVPTSEIRVSFTGPFAWLPGGSVPSVGEAAESKRPGIYLWTAPSPKGHLVYYVGETARTVAARIEEHLYEQLSGRYRFYEPSPFLMGEKKLVWRGVYGQGAQPNVSGFVDQLPTFAPLLTQFVKNMRFLVATTDCSDRVRRRIEAALATWFRQQAGLVGEFQDAGIHYEPRLEEEPAVKVDLAWQEKPIGAPDHVEA